MLYYEGVILAITRSSLLVASFSKAAASLQFARRVGHFEKMIGPGALSLRRVILILSRVTFAANPRQTLKSDNLCIKLFCPQDPRAERTKEKWLHKLWLVSAVFSILLLFDVSAYLKAQEDRE
jgi:hypothetical protein